MGAAVCWCMPISASSSKAALMNPALTTRHPSEFTSRKGFICSSFFFLVMIFLVLKLRNLTLIGSF